VEKHRRILLYVLIAALSVASLKILWLLGSMLLFEGQTRLVGDATTFFVVAKGLLNGHELYTELFEMKPPGIIYLSALSLLIANNEIPLTMLKIAFMGAIPVFLVCFGFRVLKQASAFTRTCGLFSSLLFGSGIAIYTIERAAGLQAEPFGVFFAVLYVLIIAWDTRSIPVSRIILASLAMLFAVGMREQFLFPLLAAGMLLSRNWKFFMRSFVFPCCIALGSGVLIMMFFGYLVPYISIYLPDAFAARIQTNELGTLWMRGLHGWIVFLDLSYLFVMPLFGVVVGILWMGVGILKTRVCEWKYAVVSLVCIGGGILFFNLIVVSLLLLFNRFEHTIVQYAAFVFAICAVSALLFVSGVIYLVIHKRALLPHVFVVICAVYPVVLAAGAAHFNVYQLSTAVPAYLAVFVLFLAATAEVPQLPAMRLLVPIVTGVLFLMPFVGPMIDWQERYIWQSEENMRFMESKAYAGDFDAMMDRCGFSRYLPWAGGFRLAEHSPIQMNWTIFRSYGENPSPHFRQQTINNLLIVPIVVKAERRYKDDELMDILYKNFTLTPPACAADYKSPEHFTIYYRKGLANGNGV